MFMPQVSVDSKPERGGGECFPFCTAALRVKEQPSKDLGKTNVHSNVVQLLTSPIHFLIAKIYGINFYLISFT